MTAANELDPAGKRGAKHRERDVGRDEPEVKRRRHAERRHGDVGDVEPAGIGSPVMHEHVSLHVRQAVAPGVGREDRNVRGREGQRHGAKVPAAIRTVGAGVAIGNRVEQRVDAQVLRHVLGRQHQSEGGAARRIPALGA